MLTCPVTLASTILLQLQRDISRLDQGSRAGHSKKRTDVPGSTNVCRTTPENLSKALNNVKDPNAKMAVFNQGTLPVGKAQYDHYQASSGVSVLRIDLKSMMRCCMSDVGVAFKTQV
jgi:hypothetical protein